MNPNQNLAAVVFGEEYEDLQVVEEIEEESYE